MVIKKRVSFAFLGDEYKDAYGVFASIPVSEYPDISKTIDAEDNNLKKSIMMLDLIKKKFIEGKFPDEKGDLQDLTAEGLDLDGELLVTVYNRLMGGAGDPKVSEPSETS